MHRDKEIKSNPMHHPSGALPLPNVPARLTRGVFVALIVSRLRLLAVELLNTAFLLWPSQCLCGTILMTLCLMVWDWRVLRAGPMPSCLPNLLFLLVSYYFLLFFLPWVGCVGLGSSDWYSVRTLSQPCTTDSFLIIIIIIINDQAQQTHVY